MTSFSTHRRASLVAFFLVANTTLLACGSDDSDGSSGTGGTSAGGTGGSAVGGASGSGSGGASAGSGGASAGSGGASAGSGGASAGSGGASAGSGGASAGAGGTAASGGSGGTTSSGNWKCTNPNTLLCNCTDGGNGGDKCNATSYPCCILFAEVAGGPSNKCQCNQADATQCDQGATALKGKQVTSCPP
ncbi:MAG: hypothetical protein IPI67_24185 [Myxococcales bacterium]|nr:hypothetical protein [Myxococcales bacterium]